MRQFVLPPDYSGEPRLILRGARRHYLVNVLRFREGSRFPGRDAKGGEVEILLESVGEHECTLLVRRSHEEPEHDSSPEASERLTLFQCIPKGKKMDLIVRQATEAGVARIVPVSSRHTIPRYEAGEWSTKSERWSRVMREALQQCGGGDPPELAAPIPLREVPGWWSERGPALFFHERPLAQKSLHEYLVEDAGDVALVIGPEGGLAPEETSFLQAAGFGAVFLGPNVLRVETATLFAIAAARIVLLEKSRWRLDRR